MTALINIEHSDYVKALAHPMRIRIFAMLQEQTASPVQLASKLEATLGAVAYHVRTLHNLGLIELVSTRQRRGATEHYYRAKEPATFSDEAWDQLEPVAKQRLLSAMLRQIGEYTSRSAAAGGFDRADAHISRTPLRVDRQGWSQLVKATRKWLAEVDRIASTAEERLDRPGGEHDAIDAGVVIMLFEALPFSTEAPPLPREPGTTTSKATKRRNGTHAPARG